MVSRSITASILDLQVQGAMERIRARAVDDFPYCKNDDARLSSLAFVQRCVEITLELTEEDAYDCLTEGGNDLAIDALYIGDQINEYIPVSIFQCKYYSSTTNHAFAETDVIKLIDTIGIIFDVNKKLPKINRRLEAKIEYLRSSIKGKAIPSVTIYACNNGEKWNYSAQVRIDELVNKRGTDWQYVNHDVLYDKQIPDKPVNDTLLLEGSTLFEKKDFREICLGRIPVSEIARIMADHKERLLDRNIRRFLGFKKNIVNTGIKETLIKEPQNFYYYNNGITIICNEMDYNKYQDNSHGVRLKNINIINGGQTCSTILSVETELKAQGQELSKDASVLVRIYKLSSEERDDIVSRITLATNSQNPVDLKDLRSNDKIQKMIEENLKQFGYKYLRSRSGDSFSDPNSIRPATVAQAVLVTWLRKPGARLRESEHFSTMYDEIFNEKLNAVQIIIAVLIFRIAENRRKRPLDADPNHVSYSSGYVAMLMGEYLLKELGIGVGQLDSNKYEQAKTLLNENHDKWIKLAIEEISSKLEDIYQDEQIKTFQKLAAIFRKDELVDSFYYYRET
ncbi:MAG: AIPR family protein [Candidatus Symbiobacter sp.]|nr:AIPR family protein [Candidatus Symbiobacter sp.]